MAVKTYRKTALVTAEQFLPAIGQIPNGVYSDGHGDPRMRPDCHWVLDTKEGRHDVRGGDYICTGPAGEQWNVAKEIFEVTYEEVGFDAVSAIAPPSAVSETVKVKSLRWRKYGNQNCSGWQGMGTIGYLQYVVDRGPEGEEGWFWGDRGFDTEDEAKAAVQADYETCIRSALTSQAVEAEGGAA